MPARRSRWAAGCKVAVLMALHPHTQAEIQDCGFGWWWLGGGLVDGWWEGEGKGEGKGEGEDKHKAHCMQSLYGHIADTLSVAQTPTTR
jgi:hypothetical protein